MENLQLQAVRRVAHGKGGAHKLRREGFVPAVIYGHGEDPLSLAIPAVPLRRALLHAGSGTVMVQLQIGEGPEAQEQLAMIKEIQREPVSRQVLHLDFQAVSLTERLTITVPVEVTGAAPGVDEGGILQVVLHQISVECLPLSIPARMVADVSGLHLHDSLTAGDLPLPEGVTLLTDRDEPVVVVSSASGLEAPAEAEEEAEEEADES